ncbi:alpha/beta hydrolase [Halobacteria archaeon AArc-dxtr1]|nr:alpha/beta hydrolase [Halobacteria archaeon AArc-dxtr1]
METVDHHGRETAYRVVSGPDDGSTVCLVHGSGGSSATWSGQDALADAHTVVGVDLSGHGASADIDAAPGYTTLSAYADDVIAVARATDADVLVGASLGGAVVLHVLLEREFDPEAVIVTGVGPRPGVLEDLIEWLARDFERAVEFLHEPDRFFHDPESALRERSIEQLFETGRAVTERDFLTYHAFDARGELGAVSVPVLAVYGTYDQLSPPHEHERLAAALERASLVEVREAAHLPMCERPGAFNDAVRSFLS